MAIKIELVIAILGGAEDRFKTVTDMVSSNALVQVGEEKEIWEASEDGDQVGGKHIECL